MIKTSNSDVRYLIDEEIAKSGSDMTTALSDFGDGSMPHGLNALWKDGERTGIIEGAIATIILVALCKLGEVVAHKRKVRQAIESMRNEEKTEPPCEGIEIAPLEAKCAESEVAMADACKE